MQRGDYLVNTIMTCGNCHTPKGPPAAIAGKDFSGGLRFDEPPFDVTAPNITPDPNTGIGNWTDAEIKKALIDGVRPNGVPLAPIMPSGFYAILTPDDADAIVAYLQSLKPVGNKVPIRSTRQPFASVFPGTEQPMAAADMSDKIKHGFYLAPIGALPGMPHAACARAGCDSTRSARAAANFPGRGASRWRATSRRARPRASANGATTRSRAPSPQGKRRDGSPLKPPMGYGYYAKMTDGDLNAVVAYLRTLPPKE